MIDWKIVKEDSRYTVTDAVGTKLFKLQLSKTELHAGKSTTGHKHDAEEVYIFREGQGVIQLNDSLHNIRPGDVVTIPGGVFHKVINTKADHTCHKLVFYSVFEKYEGRGK